MRVGFTNTLKTSIYPESLNGDEHKSYSANQEENENPLR